MSAAVRAALAVKRAEHRSRSRSTSPTKPAAQQDDSHLLPNFGSELDASLSSPFGSPKPRPKAAASGRFQNSAAMSSSTDTSASLNQRSEADIVRASVSNGKINMSARAPSLDQVPDLVLSLLSDEPPKWYIDIPEDEREPWFSREELHTLQLGNNELQQLPDRLCDFQGLKRLELYSNRLTSLPSRFFQLTTLTSLNLANNSLTTFPTCLLALDNLVTLNLSNNKIQSLWTDSDVASARSERESWDKLNATEENGIWAGLSPSKKDRKALIPEAPRDAPLCGLRTLDLSNNRLTNAALGIPDLSGARAKIDSENPVRLPLYLKKLDLGRNPVRGPILTVLFTNLLNLEDLSLQGCGIADNVFSIAETTSPTLASLTTLDVSGCEIDALDPLEALFGSRRIKGSEQALGLREDYDQSSTLPSPTPGLAPRQLVRVLNRPNASDLAKMEQITGGKVLCVLLEGNLLREEGFRQKRGGSPKKAERIVASEPKANSVSPDLDAGATPAAPKTTQTSFTVPSGLPAKPTVVKEEWELLAESGLNTELGRRKLRIEQARRAQEDALIATNMDETEARGRSRAVADGATVRAASKSVGADADPSKENSPSKDRASGPDDSADDSATGSALANAKLSTKKKEALGQVPCKFFRSNGCSAGASCPFAHTLPGDVVQKSVCQWFLKGSCRFGHKCALAHVLPGQPMSMDRKNKRAAQHGQPLPQMPHQPSQVSINSQSPSQAQTTTTATLASATSSNFNPATATFQPSQNKLPSNVSRSQQSQDKQEHHWQSHQSRQMGAKTDSLYNARDHDFPFGLPDDLQVSATPAPGTKRPGFESSQSASATSALPPNEASGFKNSSSLQRPVAPSQSYSASFASPSLGSAGGLDSAAAAAAFGSSASARALGTSPFSHPGGHSLFFSGSQDSEGGAGPFARSTRDHFGARSANMLDDPAAAKWWSSLGTGANRNTLQGDNNKTEEIEDAEGLLPSSLSDLLTPVELERRGRNGRLSNSFAGDEERVPIAQSMPSSHDPGLLRGVKTPIGAQRSMEPQASNLSTGLLQHQQSQRSHATQLQAQFLRESKGGEGLRPFEDNRVSGGLDSMAFRERVGAGFAPSSGRSAIHHAPGQSLPQGLAAGLSQLHLRNGGSGNQDHAAVQRGGISSQLGGATGGLGGPDKTGGYSTSQSSQSGFGGNALRLPGSLDDFGLGPTAPSSMLAHRSPLIFASSGPFGSPGSGNTHFPSPPLSAIGSQRSAGAIGETGSGIAIPDSSGLAPHASRQQQQQPMSRYGNSMQHQYQHSYAQHPGMQRIRAGSSAAPTPHSPLSLPVATAEEDEDEAIFELE